MRTLEDILVDYFGCNEPFDSNGEFTNDGYKSYNKLLNLIYDLFALGIITTYDEAVRELDNISDSYN